MTHASSRPLSAHSRWRRLFRHGLIGGAFALARFLRQRTRRTWRGLADFCLAEENPAFAPPKKTLLEVERLGERTPPSDSLCIASLGLPVFAGALCAIGYEGYQPNVEQTDGGGFTSWLNAAERGGQQDRPSYENQSSLPLEEPQFHFGAGSGNREDEDAEAMPFFAAEASETDELLDLQRSPESGEPNALFPKIILPSGGTPLSNSAADTSGEHSLQSIGHGEMANNSASSPFTNMMPSSASNTSASSMFTGANATATTASGATSNAVALTSAGGAGSSSTATTPQTTHEFLQPSQANQGIVFTQNVGQTSSQVNYLAMGGSYSLFLTGGGVVMELTQPPASTSTTQSQGSTGDQSSTAQTATTEVLSMQMVGANANPAVQGQDMQTGRSNYFIGANAYTNVAEYGKVLYSNVYQNIGVEYYSNSQGQLEYDFIAGPKADLSQIKLSFQGANSVSINANGNLVLSTAVGNIVEEAPDFYQIDSAGNKVAVAGQYQLNADGTVGFTASDVTASETLYVDPVVSSPYLIGGSSFNGATGTAVDGAGNVFLTGWTYSTDFPTTTGSYKTTYGGGTKDAFVAKLDPNNNQIYTTYLGGSGKDIAYGIAVDAAGDAFVTGATSSTNFHTTPGALASFNPSAYSDTFVVKLDPSGSALLYSTVLDGSANADALIRPGLLGYTYGGGIAIDAYGNAFVTGTTGDSADFPQIGGLTVGTPAGESAFIVKLNSSGNGLDFSSLLGDDATYGTSIAVDAGGSVYGVGYTDTSVSGFTTAGGGYNPGGSGYQAFVVKISPSYTWDYRALLGYDAGADGQAHYIAGGVAVNGSGNAFVAGYGYDTGSSNYTNYALEMTSDGTTLVYDTEIITSASLSGAANGISLDASGDAWVVGYDSSDDLAPVNATASWGGSTDGYLAELSPGSGSITFASYLGGTADEALAVAQNPLGKLAVAGVDLSSWDAMLFVFNSAPPAPVVSGISPDTGYSSSDGITTDTGPEIYGTAPVGSTVTLYRDGVVIDDAVSVNGSGDWDYTEASALAQDGYDYTATDTLDGATSDFSNAFIATIDSTAPLVTVTVAAEVTSLSPIVQVTATDMVGLPPSGTVTLTVDGGTYSVIGTLVDGTADIQLPTLSGLGTYTVVAQTDDLAGNTGTSATATFDVVSSGWGLTDATRQFNPLGTNMVSHALDLDTSPGTDQSLDAALDYNSADISPQPTVLANLQTDNSTSLPPTMTVDLYWDGVDQGSTNYSLTDYTQGDQIPISAQVTSAVTTGLHTYTLYVSFPGSAVTTQTISGTTFAVSENGSPADPFGAGWSFSALDQLDSITTTSSQYPYGGMLRIAGDGTWSFYAQTTSMVADGYTSPSGDFGTLTAISGGSGGYKYTAPDGEETVFNSSGQETGWTSGDGFETIVATYSSGKLHTFTAIDGTTSTFVYTGSLVTSIDTGSRIVTLTYTSGDLTQITDPDTRVESYTYSSDLMTEDQLGDDANTNNNIYTNWDYQYGLLIDEFSGDLGVTTPTYYQSFSPGLFGPAPVATAPAGDQWGYSTDSLSNQTWDLYDTYGRLIEQVSPNGGIDTWDRDLNGLVTQSTDALGNTTTYAYDSISGTPFSGTTTTGSPIVTLISSTSGLTAGMYVSGSGIPAGAEILSVDSGTQITLTDNVTTGGTLTITPATPDGYLTGETLPDSLGSLSFTYENVTNTTASGVGMHAGTGLNMRLLESSVSALGATIDYDYDSYGHATTIVQAVGESYAMTMTYVYNDSSNGLLSAVYNSEGNLTTTYAYDGTLLTGETDYTSSGSYTHQTYTYDSNGNVASYTDNDGYTTSYTNDAMGRVLTQVLDGVTQTWVYNAAGEESKHFDGNGNEEDLSYNSRGDLIEDYQGVGSSAVDISLYQYDDDDNLIASRDGDGNWTYSSYDGDRNLVSQSDQLGDTQQFDYNLNDQQVASRDANGNWSTVTLNALGYVTASTDGRGKTTTMTVDAAGDVLTQEDPDTNVTSYTYDVLGREVQTEDALTNYITITYDNDGNVATTVEMNDVGTSVVTSFAYDYQGDQIGETVDTGGGSPRTTTQTFDGNGNVLTSTDANGNTVTDTYDAFGNVKTQQTSDGTSTFTTTYAYDGDNNLLTTAILVGGTVYTTTYDYNSLDQLRSVTDPGARTTTTQEDPNGNVVETIDGAGDAAANSYNAAGELVLAVDPMGNPTQYQYDATANLIAETDPDGNTTHWGFNADNQVIQQISPTGGVTTTTYDNASNVATVVDPDGREKEYSYNADNQVTTVVWLSSVGGTHVNTLTYSYYTNGELESAGDSGGTYTFTYDDFGNVATVQDGYNGLTLTYTCPKERTHRGCCIRIGRCTAQ